PGSEPNLVAGVAVELVHMATLVHDDVIDGAAFRRGRFSAWQTFGADAARAAGDYLFARAFAELAATGDPDAVSVLAGAALCLARGEALQRSQTHDPDTPVDAYLERCELKTGKLFEAACVLGGRGLGSFGLALGVAFQIVDDILDCSGETIETGKIAGVDLREGTPTLPLLLAARQDDVVRRALAGGPLDGALVRVGGDEVYFVQNLYLNQTNVCRVKCKFCAFAATSKQPHAYTISPAELVEDAVRQRESTGFTEIHMVNGESPHVGFDFYVDTVRALHEALPDVHLKLYTASEIHHMTRL